MHVCEVASGVKLLLSGDMPSHVYGMAGTAIQLRSAAHVVLVA